MKHRVHSHYETLHVDRDASAQLVRLAYRRMAQKFHPDRYQGKGDSAAVMAQINRAYEALSDAKARETYDQWLAQEEEHRARPRLRLATAGAGAAEGAGAPLPLPAWGGGWSWYLLYAVLGIIVVTLGWVALKSLAPKKPAFQIPAGLVQPLPVVDSTPIAPLPKIEPWTPPPKSALPDPAANDPVARLVRDGVLTKAKP